MKSIIATIKRIYLQTPPDDWEFSKLFETIENTPGWLTKEEAFTLYKLSSKMKFKDKILEIGSYAGKSTLALSAHLATVTTIDPHTGDKTEVEAGLKIDTYEALLESLKKEVN